MARKRMLSPQIWDDEDFNKLSFPERLLFIGLFSYSDDYCHVTASAIILRKWIFGYDSVTTDEVAQMLDHILGSMRNVRQYRVDDKNYLWLPKEAKHQDLRFRAKATYPCHVCHVLHESKDYEMCEAYQDELNVVGRKKHATYTQESRKDLVPREEKRREEKRKHLRGDESPQAQNDESERRASVPTEEKQSAKRKSLPAEKVRPVFAALARRCNYDLKRLTTSERGVLNKAAYDLVLADYGPPDVDTMADNYLGHFTDCAMTPSAIAKHATRLMTPPPKQTRSPNRKADSAPAALSPEESLRAYPEYARTTK